MMFGKKALNFLSLFHEFIFFKSFFLHLINGVCTVITAQLTSPTSTKSGIPVNNKDKFKKINQLLVCFNFLFRT